MVVDCVFMGVVKIHTNHSQPQTPVKRKESQKRFRFKGFQKDLSIYPCKWHVIVQKEGPHLDSPFHDVHARITFSSRKTPKRYRFSTIYRKTAVQDVHRRFLSLSKIQRRRCIDQVLINTKLKGIAEVCKQGFTQSGTNS